jgi:hypothetical protein
MNPDNENDELFAIESLAELYVVAYRFEGLEGVERLLQANTATRQSLRRDAVLFASIGMGKLASLLRRCARKAKLGAPTFDEKWRVAERRSGALPGFVPHRRRN